MKKIMNVRVPKVETFFWNFSADKANFKDLFYTRI